jgi:hypothetical protein
LPCNSIAPTTGNLNSGQIILQLVSGSSVVIYIQKSFFSFLFSFLFFSFCYSIFFSLFCYYICFDEIITINEWPIYNICNTTISLSGSSLDSLTIGNVTMSNLTLVMAGNYTDGEYPVWFGLVWFSFFFFDRQKYFFSGALTGLIGNAHSETLYFNSIYGITKFQNSITQNDDLISLIASIQ